MRARSSIGRARPWHGRGKGFETPRVHNLQYDGEMLEHLPPGPGPLPEMSEPEIFWEKFTGRQITRMDNPQLQNHIVAILSELHDTTTNLRSVREDISTLEQSVPRSGTTGVPDPYPDATDRTRKMHSERIGLLTELIPRGQKMEERYLKVLKRFTDVRTRRQQEGKWPSGL